MSRFLKIAVVLVVVLGTASVVLPQEDCEYIEGRIEHWEGRVTQYSPGGSNPDAELLEIAETMVEAWGEAYENEGCEQQA